MTISDQSVPMFHDEVTHQIHLALGSIGHPGSTIQGSAWYLSLMRRGPFSITSLDQATNSCSTVQALKGVSVFYETRPFYFVVQALRGVSVFDEIMPFAYYFVGLGLKVVINPYKLAFLPAASIDKAFLVIVMQFSIGKMIKRRQNSIIVYRIDRTGYHFCNWWS